MVGFSGGKLEEFGNELVIQIRGLLSQYVSVEKWVEIKAT